jgi:predicted ATP-grasp superfamily ATP-dependent carboligase
VLSVRARWERESRTAAGELGYPMVLKPARGAGCEGVSLVRNGRELREALRLAGQNRRPGRLLLQDYVPGTSASVSLIADGRRSVALAANAQTIRASRPFSYRGGVTPLEPEASRRAVDAASRACAAFPGLRGYIGVDLVLTKSAAIVIEVNPRLTTSYLGVRASLDGNVAAMALAACSGTLGVPPAARKRVRFTADGQVIAAEPIRAPARSRAAGRGHS